MSTESIRIDHQPSPDDLSALAEHLIAFNTSQVGSSNRRPLLVAAHDADDQLVAGLEAFTLWNWLFVAYLWVHETRRGEGLGTRLVRVAEQEGARLGCTRVHLDTFSFQALDFYRKLGFRVFGSLEDYPPGHTRYFLRKDLQA